MTNKYIISALAIFTCLILNNIAKAQITRDSLFSGTLNEKRYLQIYLPENYNTVPAEKYDVVYLADGEWTTQMIVQIQQLLHRWDFTPGVIVVGIENKDNWRRRDLTPTNSGSPSGGAAAFLKFIKNELIPFINKKYHSSGSNTLFGHSYGGLFTMYALLTEPQTFDSYIAADPALWWDNGYMNKLAIQKLSGITGLKSLYLTGRTGKAYHDMGIDSMESVLRAKAPADLHWQTNSYADETHVSAQFKSAYDGLKYSYTGYKKDTIALTPMAGIAVKGIPYKVRFDEAFARVAYTINGAEPSEGSATMNDTITLQTPGHFIARTLCFHPQHNKSSVANFDEGKLWTAKPPKQSLMNKGLHYAYYEGNWDSLPAFQSLHPMRTGTAGIDIDIDSLQNGKQFALLVTGFLEIRENGYYTFVVTTDDAGALYLNHKAVIVKRAGGGESQSYMLPLSKGIYPLRFEYLHKKGTYSINLTWYSPATNKNEDPSSIPLEQLYR